MIEADEVGSISAGELKRNRTRFLRKSVAGGETGWTVLHLSKCKSMKTPRAGSRE